MKITDKQLTEYQNIYFKEYGKKIDKKTAYKQAVKLLVLVETIYKNNLPK